MRLTSSTMPFLAAVAVAATACSSSDTGTTPGGTDFGMSATINGASWVTQGKPGASYRQNIFSIAGLNLTSYGVSMAVGTVTTAGTYSLAYSNTQAGSGIVTNTTGAGWGTGFPGGTGSITFTTLTANHAVGTFAFHAVVASGNATGTIDVTNGKFDVTY